MQLGGYVAGMPYDPDPAVVWTVLGCWLIFAGVWIAGWIYNFLHAPKVERRSISPTVLLGAGIAWFISWLIPTSVWDALLVVSPVL